MNEIIYHNGKKNRQVKNVRWLREHRREVKYVEVFPQNMFELPLHNFEVRILAKMKNGYTFRADFADKEICLKWLNKRGFRVYQFT